VIKERNFGLDIIRAISILFVLIAHRFELPIELGLLGVQFFFVLSGFLIGQILIKDFINGAKMNTVFKFWKRRWFRTLPLYYLILSLKILFYGNPYGWKIIVYYFFLQANFVGISFFPVSWSLIVEEWFYIVLPIAVYIFFSKKLLPKQFMYFLFVLIFVFFCLRFFWNYYQKGIIIYQFDCLLLGVLMALLKIKYQHIYKALNSVSLFLTASILVAGLIIILGKYTAIPLYATFYRVVWYFLISICIVLIIPFTEQSVFINSTLRKVKPLYWFFTWTSILTYSIYLIHMDVQAITFTLNDGFSKLVYILVLYLFSFLIYYFYEHPMMSLRDEFSLKKYFSNINLTNPLFKR